MLKILLIAITALAAIVAIGYFVFDVFDDEDEIYKDSAHLQRKFKEREERHRLR